MYVASNSHTLLLERASTNRLQLTINKACPLPYLSLLQQYIIPVAAFLCVQLHEQPQVLLTRVSNLLRVLPMLLSKSLSITSCA
jgi:hypothetical protein